MFFEYLSAGRCDALEGTYGAYNLYESECRANLIIPQLNQILESLEQIKKNQFTVYNELQAIKVAINDLAYSMDRLGDSLKYIKCDTTDMKDYLNTVSQNSSVIAHNTAVAAHYSKIYAELTNSRGYLIALN